MAGQVMFDEAKVDEVFADLDQNGLPGAAVGIAIGGVPVYRKAFGLASMELPTVLTTTTRLRIGSISKHFAALAYLLLCEDGLAELDAPVGKYLSDLHPVTHDVTMRQLMGHIGGLRDVFDLAWALSGTGTGATSADLLSLYRDLDDVNAAPGTEYNYCNGGYLILGTVIEQLTGQPLEDVLRERVFAVAWLHDTLLRRVDTDFVPNSATLHTPSPGGGFEKSYLGTAIAGEGGIVSTVEDMLRWLAHLDAPVVGSPRTWAAMKTPQTLANGTSTGYGLGLITDHYRGAPTLWHTGGVMGGNAQLLTVPGAGLDVVIMLNRSDVSAALLVNKVLDSCLSGLDPVPAPQPHPVAAGTFRSPVSGRVIQLLGDEEQLIAIDGEELRYSYDGRVFTPAEAISHTVPAVRLVGDERHPSAVELHHLGAVDELLAVPDTADPQSIDGRYRSASTGSDITIHESVLTSSGRFGSVSHPLEYVADGTWRARPVGAWTGGGGILSFSSDGSAFRLSRPRTRPLPFQRHS
jgi:CubicO group peptidase (beta-lactamase class C family)